MTTNDNLRGLLALLPELGDALEDLEIWGRHSDQGYRKLKDWYRKIEIETKRIDAALAAPDSGEVVMPRRASLSNVDVILGALGMYGRVDFGQAVKIYNQALDDVIALNKATALAEPGTGGV